MCVFLKHCLEGTSGDYLVLCSEVSCLEPAGIGCVQHRAVPPSLYRDLVQLPQYQNLDTSTQYIGAEGNLVPQPVKVPLDGSTGIWCISHSSQLCFDCKGTEGALCPTDQALNKGLEQDSSTDSCSTGLLTGLQQDIVPLITAL